ncbi:zinc-ribbon domain-containing protein [Streptomyces sp. 1222.5]|uniref:zinc-ribbon domain-containing protein n=1 Tax=Streptomyces sp. 1222.5 TaxID=1881026 RepID=UPI003EBF3412
MAAVDVAPHREEGFVANLTNPGKTPDRMPPGCNDVCPWRCRKPDCGYEWKAILSSRALAGPRLQPVRSRMGGRSKQQTGLLPDATALGGELFGLRR